MNGFFAQAIPPSFFNAPNGSTELWTQLVIALLVGFGAVFALMKAPASVRKPVVAISTFFAGLYWVVFFLWPRPVNRLPGDMPSGLKDGVGFWLEDANSIVGNLSNVLSAFLLGLGIYSLLRIHGMRVIKGHKDAFFSAVLLVGIVVMGVFGYWDWLDKIGPNGPSLALEANWAFQNRVRDLLFDGLLQEMDAGMFSLIAFYILSAAYRAFRIRSIEATLLLATAFIVMLSFLGLVTGLSDSVIDGIKGTADPGFLDNFKLTEIAKWLRATVETPSLRGIDFGIGIGALAMGLRLWLSLEKTAVSS